jgi:hypothetical protein
VLEQKINPISFYESEFLGRTRAEMNLVKELDDKPFPNLKADGYEYFQLYHQYLILKSISYLNKKTSSLTQYLAFRTRIKNLMSKLVNL